VQEPRIPAEQRRLLAETIRRTARWRRRKADEYRDDEARRRENARVASALRTLANFVDGLPDDDPDINLHALRRTDERDGQLALADDAAVLLSRFGLSEPDAFMLRQTSADAEPQLLLREVAAGAQLADRSAEGVQLGRALRARACRRRASAGRAKLEARPAVGKTVALHRGHLLGAPAGGGANPSPANLVRVLLHARRDTCRSGSRRASVMTASGRPGRRVLATKWPRSSVLARRRSKSV
jgi:hypothetical protein